MTVLQQRDHVSVRKLPKLRVMRSDGEKRARGAQANNLVDLLSQLLERVLRACESFAQFCSIKRLQPVVVVLLRGLDDWSEGEPVGVGQ